MTDEQIRKLEDIKGKITAGGYSILQQNDWDSFAEDLSNCGVTLLKDIEQKRDEVREFNISYFFFFGLRKLNKLNSSYDEIIKNYDLFFDAGMRWLSSIINGNKYEEYQILKREN